MGELVHAMGFSIRPTRRPATGQAVEATTEDIFYTHLRGLPDTIDLELQGVETDRLQQLIHQVMVEVVENSP